MGNSNIAAAKEFELSEFQKQKLLREFEMFYDVNKDGCLQWKDFLLARDNICKMSGWKLGTEKYMTCQENVTEIWRALQNTADEDADGIVTKDEWLQMWKLIEAQERQNNAKREEERKKRMKERKSQTEEEDDDLETDLDAPEWLEKYIKYKFDLLNRTGDGVIDIDEFEYVLSGFDVSSRDSRTAFTMMTQKGKKEMNFRLFRVLAVQYYRSDDPDDPGTHINGKFTMKEPETVPEEDKKQE